LTMRLREESESSEETSPTLDWTALTLGLCGGGGERGDAEASEQDHLSLPGETSDVVSPFLQVRHPTFSSPSSHSSSSSPSTSSSSSSSESGQQQPSSDVDLRLLGCVDEDACLDGLMCSSYLLGDNFLEVNDDADADARAATLTRLAAVFPLAKERTLSSEDRKRFSLHFRVPSPFLLHPALVPRLSDRLEF